MIKFLTDRQLRDAVTNLLKQRDRSAYVRIVTPWMSDIQFPDGEALTTKLRNLRVRRAATISLVVNPDRRLRSDQAQTLRYLQELGVHLHFKHQLHAKIVLVESVSERYALITSANITRTGLNIQNEAGLLVTDEEEILDTVMEYSNHLMDTCDNRITLDDLAVFTPAEEARSQSP